MSSASSSQLLAPLANVIRDLQNKFGSWKIAWGDINRFQRISGDIDLRYEDNKPSLAVPFVSSRWGMLPSFARRYFEGTKKRYGVGRNSFICAVEFGKKIKAKSILAGGESGNPSSKHFTDQAEMFTRGEFKEVCFTKKM